MDEVDEKPAMSFVVDLSKLLIDHAAFSQKAFGSDDVIGPLGPVKHLKKECDEILDDPSDTSEYIDALFLVSDAIRRHLHQNNLNPYDFVRIGREKLEILEARKWPAPLDGEPRLHIKQPTT